MSNSSDDRGSSSGERGARPTVLVVDDERVLREVVARRMRSAGFSAIEAGSGEEALDLMARSRVDVVVLDLGLPGIDGDEVCRRIRSSPALATMGVLILSSLMASLDHRTRVMVSGADGYIGKPFHPDELIAWVSRLAARRRA